MASPQEDRGSPRSINGNEGKTFTAYGAKETLRPSKEWGCHSLQDFGSKPSPSNPPVPLPDENKGK
ncbi:hypothetical protein, partial [Salmonella enterica]|uniref:hypothetical protein n=1 Tax=Salmonella enterica TaxID=28901 RepID=UPI003CEBAC6E